MYVDDVKSAVDCEVALYADDSSLILSSKCVTQKILVNSVN